MDFLMLCRYHLLQILVLLYIFRSNFRKLHYIRERFFFQSYGFLLIILTTNDLESFYTYYNSQFYTNNPHVHQVMDIIIIIEIQNEIYLKMYTINNTIISIKGRETVNKEFKIL